jgi:hypothetical protein
MQILRFVLIPFAFFAFAFCFGALAIWYLSKRSRISQNATGSALHVESLIGTLDVQQEAKLDPRLARIPLYPGSMMVNPAAAQSVSEAHFGRRTLQEISASYWTMDSTEQVWEFYRHQLPDWPRNLADARGRELICHETDCVLLLRIAKRQDDQTLIEMMIKPPGYPNLFERRMPLENRVRPSGRS